MLRISQMFAPVVLRLDLASRLSPWELRTLCELISRHRQIASRNMNS